MSLDSAVLAYPVVRSHSPEFSETLNNHVFIKNVFAPKITPADTSRQIKESHLRNSLEEISKDIKEIEDFITVTEDILKRERERDKEFYARERQRKNDTGSNSMGYNKENKSPVYSIYSVKSPTYKRDSSSRRTKSGSLKSNKSMKLSFKNGRIGCMDSADSGATTNNVQETHEIVKNIIKLKRDPSDDSVFLDSVQFDDSYGTHEYISCKRSSLDDDEYGMELNETPELHNRQDVKGSSDNLEMVIIDRSNEDGVQCSAGTVVGSGNGMESLRAAPSSASSAHSNIT